jgi:hypothetical protein
MALTDALIQWRSRKLFPTEFGSAELRTMSREFRMRSIFAARLTNAEAAQKLSEIVDRMLAGEINQATGRLEFMRELARLGYDPAKGFPQDMADVPPAEAGSLRDLSSASRIDLMLETNERMAANYGRMLAGNTDAARYAYPAWELVRLYWREVPRGSAESKSVGWGRRWNDAGDFVAFDGVLKSSTRMVALKGSPIWQALGDGEGGYEDTLGNPFPPFAFRSGFGWRAVSRGECDELGMELKAEGRRLKAEVALAPGANEVRDALARLGPEFSKNLFDGLEGIAERGAEATRATRIRQAQASLRNAETVTERREAHRAFVASLVPEEEAA